MNGKDYKEDELISEGGYGYVYRVTLKASKDDQKNADSPSKTEQSKIEKSNGAPNKKSYALKRMFVQDQDQADKVLKEAELWKQIGTHPNIVEYVDSQLVKRFDSRRGTEVTEMLIVCSLCQGGFTLIDMIEQCNG